MLTRIQDQVYPLANWEFEMFQDESGNFSFHGASVCDYFELKNPSVTIQRYVDEDWRFKAPVELGKGSNSWMIKEPGLYQLAMMAKTPQAKEFQKWVYSDLLPKLRASGGYIMPTATSEQLSGLIKEANQKLLALYKSRSVTYKKDKDGAVKMTVYKNRVKEYETYISDCSSPSLVNPQILIIRNYDPRSNSCDIDIDSPLKEAYVRWRDYDHVCDRTWTRDELEEWIRVNFPVK